MGIMTEHGASDHVEEQSHTEMTIKIEVEEAIQSTSFVEITVKCVKEEPGSVQLVKSEPALSVTEEVVEDSRQEAQHGVETQPEQRAQSRLYKCDKCPKTFKCKRTRYVHCYRIHGTGSYECTKCNLKYKCRDYLGNHIRNVHSKQHYECTVCKKMCKSKQALRQHVTLCGKPRSAGSELRNYVCDYCQKTYKVKYHVQNHITNVHSSRSYRCGQCNKRFKCKLYVMNHMANMHSASMRECNVCGKSVRPHYLKTHMLIMHNDEQMHCKLCGEVTKSKQYLRQHLKDCHGQQSAESLRLFTCSKCGKKLKSKWNCQQHEKSGKCSRPTASNTCALASTSTQQQHRVVTVKEEPTDGELELGPVVFQHMDCNYQPYEPEPQLD